MSSNEIILQKETGFKLQVWAARKDGKIPAIIVPTFHGNFDQIDELKTDGKFQEAYNNFKDFVARNNPNIVLISEE